MDDEPGVISSGSPHSPESVASKTFATGFRGYDQGEVRNFLKKVAEQLSAAAAREAELREALLEAHRQVANPELDEETLTTALGEHAAHLLTKAREAAANIVAEAEKRAARIMGEAEVRIARVRSEADGLLARRSEEADRMTAGVRQAAEAAARTLRDRARAEAEAEVESARKQGREMVGEARAVRERMLADLTRRRRTAEVQIEHLRMARARLLDAYSVVRRTLDEATHELNSAEADAGPVLDAAAGRLPRERDGNSGSGDAGRSGPSGRRPTTGPSQAGDHPQPRPAVSAPSAQELARPSRRTSSAPATAAPAQTTPSLPKLGAVRVEAPKGVPAGTAAGDATDVDGGSGGEPDIEDQKDKAPKPDAATAEAGNDEGVQVDAADGEAPTVKAPTAGAGNGEVANGDAPKVEPNGDATNGELSSAQPPTVEAGKVNGGKRRRRKAKEARIDAARADAVAEASAAAAVGEAEAAPGSPTADELFARLRAARTSEPVPAATGARPAAPSPEPASTASGGTGSSSSQGGSGVLTAPAPDRRAPGETSTKVREESALARRDQVLEPLEADLVRRLKRVLQDEQNEVLDRLRRERRPTPQSVLPSLDEQVERYQVAAAPILAKAADEGAQFIVAPGTGPDAASTPVEPSSGARNAERLAADLATDLVGPLRERLEASISAAIADADSDQGSYDVTGVTEGLSASYRQWRGTRIAEVARQHASAAFSAGAYSATPEGTGRCWVVDDDGGPCPDCDDNTLAGAVVKGEPFPTGQTHPPAHDGCRCLLVAPPS